MNWLYSLVEEGFSYLNLIMFQLHCQHFYLIKHLFILSLKALQYLKGYLIWVTPKESSIKNFPVMNISWHVKMLLLVKLFIC